MLRCKKKTQARRPCAYPAMERTLELGVLISPLLFKIYHLKQDLAGWLQFLIEFSQDLQGSRH